jgi:hypothetical protein
MSVERAINNMNAADHTFRSALRQHRLAPPDAGFPRRLKDFADACESQQIACEYAAQEGLGWGPTAAVGGPLSCGRSSIPHGTTLAKRLRASASPRSLAPSASWPRSRATCPPRSPKKTGRRCLACSTAEPIAEDPTGRQPTFGIVARTTAPSSRKEPRRLRPRYDESPVFLFDGAAWSSLAPRSLPPTERAPPHNIPAAAANESQPSTSWPASASSPASSTPRHAWSRLSAKPPRQLPAQPDIPSSRPSATASCDFRLSPSRRRGVIDANQCH